MRDLSPLAEQRKKLDLCQAQMAALLKTCQSEVSKTENGERPVDVRKWARAYGVTPKKFVRLLDLCGWCLPLWKSAVKRPADIEHIDCTRKQHSA